MSGDCCYTDQCINPSRMAFIHIYIYMSPLSNQFFDMIDIRDNLYLCSRRMLPVGVNYIPMTCLLSSWLDHWLSQAADPCQRRILRLQNHREQLYHIIVINVWSVITCLYSASGMQRNGILNVIQCGLTEHTQKNSIAEI